MRHYVPTDITNHLNDANGYKQLCVEFHDTKRCMDGQNIVDFICTEEELDTLLERWDNQPEIVTMRIYRMFGMGDREEFPTYRMMKY